MSYSEKSASLESRLEQLQGDGWLGPWFAQRDSDLGRGSTTISDDPQLTLTVPAPATYVVVSAIDYHGGTGVSEGDLNFGFTVTQGSLRLGALRRRTAGDWWVERMVSGDTNVSQTTGTGGPQLLSVRGSWTITAAGTPTITFRWCKNTAADGTTNTTVRQFSWLALQRADGPLA